MNDILPKIEILWNSNIFKKCIILWCHVQCDTVFVGVDETMF